MTYLKKAIKRIVPDGLNNIARAYKKKLRTDTTNRFNFYPISTDPVIIYTFTGYDLGNVFFMSQELDTGATFIVGFTRYPIDWKLLYIKRQYKLYRRLHPGNEIYFIANSTEEHQRLLDHKLNSRFINKNAFQREDEYYVESGIDKKYKAIMNARMLRLKRVELASKIDNLAIITVVDDEKYYQDMRKLLSTSIWLNYDDNDVYRYLSTGEVRRALCSSECGLILSAYEGNNKASIEYMLCGLPVVSTPSIGGRDVFFDKDYVAIVEPDEQSVRAGVDELIARNVSPARIRERTLSKMSEHRKRFLALVSELSEGKIDIDVDRWLELYPKNIRFMSDPNEFNLFLNSDFFDRCPIYASADQFRTNDPDGYERLKTR